MRIDYRWIPFVVFLSACTMGPNFEHPALQTPQWSPPARTDDTSSVAVPEPIDPLWWNSFGDPLLTELVKRAIDSNLDIKVAAARVAESRAQLGQAKADEFPTLNGNASYTRELQSADGVIGLLGGSGSPSATDTNGLGGRQGGVPTQSTGSALPPFNLFQYGFDASWELDLWGRVRRTAENASATADAQNEARHDAIVSTAAEVARDYLNLRERKRSCGSRARIWRSRSALWNSRTSARSTDSPRIWMLPMLRARPKRTPPISRSKSSRKRSSSTQLGCCSANIRRRLRRS
jgi:outer membrane protein TolC